MKAVATHSLGGIGPRQGKRHGDGRLRGVEGGVETGDLRQAGSVPCHRLHCRQVVRLVQRGQGNGAFERLENFAGDEHRTDEDFAAMHDAVPHGGDLVAVEDASASPVEEELDRPVVSQLGAACPGMLRDNLAVNVAGHEAWLGCDPFQQAANQRYRRFAAAETENFRLDEPALITRRASAMILPQGVFADAPGKSHQGDHGSLRPTSLSAL